MENKQCKTCHNDKPIEEFFEYHKTRCKECTRQWRRENREKNKEKIQAQEKARRAANPEKIKEYKRKEVERNRANPEPVRARNNAWYEKNREDQKAKKRQYYNDNKEKLKAEKKRSYEKNKEKIKARDIIYREKNKEKISARRKEYYKKNQKAICKKDQEAKKIKLKKDPQYKLSVKLRHLLREKLLKYNAQKQQSSLILLGCTLAEFKLHLEKSFKPGMTWENWGPNKDQWQIEHKIPIASFFLPDFEEQKKCFHYTNMEAAWWEDNQLKSDWMEHEGQMIRGRTLRPAKEEAYRLKHNITGPLPDPEIKFL